MFYTVIVAPGRDRYVPLNGLINRNGPTYSQAVWMVP